MAQLKAGTTIAGAIALSTGNHNNTGDPHDQYYLKTSTYDSATIDSLLAANSVADQAASAASEAAAAASAAAALVSEGNASTSAGQASTSATNANNSAIAAAASEANAATSETNAGLETGYAAEWANKAEDLLVSAAAGGDQIDDYSALHHSNKASASASAASASASAASTSASNASTSETNAATSAFNASTSETNAATSASNASTSETNAATSAGNAATSEANAAAVYDQFDDRYLGSKSSNPTLDNDGQALLTGALYWNSTENEMRVYNGTVWSIVSGGAATGATGNAVFVENDTNVTGSYTITSGKNAMSAGPITIDNGVTVTVPAGSVWTVVGG